MENEYKPRSGEWRPQGDPEKGSAEPLAQAGRDVSQRARALGREAREQIEHKVGQVKESARTTLEEQQRGLADELAALASALSGAADELRAGGRATAEYVQRAAEGIGELSFELRGRTLRDTLTAVESYGRREPATMFAGAAAIGFALSRFAKSTTPDAEQPPDDGER